MIEVDERAELGLSGMVAQLPHLANDKNAVLKLALEDYEKRREGGERPSAVRFAARFPACRTRLANLLLAREAAEANGIFDSPASAGEAEAATHGPAWPEAGDRLLGFTLLEELGRGSFSRVYLARESALGDRLVALKVSLEGKDLPDAAAEAEILGRLPHPGIVPIYSIQRDVQLGFSVVCMPYLGNTTLRDVLAFVYFGPARPARAWVILEAAADWSAADGPPPGAPSPIFQTGSYVDGVLELGSQLADALGFAHERNILHRDLKHSNVLVRPDGRPMLLDFNLSDDQTGPGKQVLGGTVLYMSPEQLRATASGPDRRPCLLDGRADLYALGVMLYELLAGDHPFISWKGPELKLGEEGLRDLLKTRQALGPRSLRRLNPLIDKRLAGVIEKCLAPDPRDRFQSAAELSAALRECLEPEYRVRRWLRGRRPRTFALAGLVVAAAALLALAASIVLPSNGRQLDQGIRALQAGNYERAVDLLTQAVAQENSFRGHMARARAYQKLGRFQQGLDDFRLADKLQPSGHTKACIAYCYSRLETPLHDGAIAYYQIALKKSYVTAGIHNNLAVSMFLFSTASDLDAKNSLRRAIALDPSFQLAHYNFFKVEVDMARDVNSKAKVTLEGVKCLENAFATGPASGQMHADAARLFLMAEHVEPLWKDRALYHFRRAIMLGQRPAFSLMDNDPRFREVVRETPLGHASEPPSRIQDPFLSIDE